MQRIVCLTPRAVELVNVDGTVVLVGDVLSGLGVTETAGAEEVVEALKLASVVLWLLGLSVKVFTPEEILGLLELSVTKSVFTEKSELAEELEPESLTVMDAVTVSVTVTAGHVWSVP